MLNVALYYTTDLSVVFLDFDGNKPKLALDIIYLLVGGMRSTIDSLTPTGLDLKFSKKCTGMHKAAEKYTKTCTQNQR